LSVRIWFTFLERFISI